MKSTTDQASLLSGPGAGSESDASAERLALLETLRNEGGVGRDLSGQDFCRADLEGVDLSAADLTGADLSYANLQGATLFRAKLAGAHLTGARLDRAELSGADLEEARLDEVHAVEAGFGQARMARASLRAADLTGALLSCADLTHADLSGATLPGARLRETQLDHAQLVRANLHSVDLSEALVHGASFERADLREARLHGIRGYESADWYGVDMRNADFNGAHLCRRHILDENFLHEFRERSRTHHMLYNVWWATSDCGRSLLRWGLWVICIACVFGFLYTRVEIDYGDYATSVSPFYFSVVTLTTLGYGDALPVTVSAQLVVMAQVMLGYVMLGGLLSIFANKMARRA